MIISIYCQHGSKMRWSTTEKGYVTIDREHRKSWSCKPAEKVVDGRRMPLGADPSARPVLTVVEP